MFHGFSGGAYSPATVTHPAQNWFWINIDLPFGESNNGTVVSGPSGWTDIVTVSLHIENPRAHAVLTWKTDSPFWGIFDGDNATLWELGSFTNLDHPLE